MGTLGIITIIGVVAVVVLFLLWRKRRTLDEVEQMIAKRKAASKQATRADFVPGTERIPIALSLTDSQIFYENADLQAQMELARIDEVEYDDELSTAMSVQKDERVLRLRSHGQTFEFILPRAEADRWSAVLPTHRADEPGKVRAV